MKPILIWFRNDLRLADNPALAAAAAAGAPVIPVYIHSPSDEGDWVPGGASRWWLHHSLTSLAASLHRLGSRLLIREGPAVETLMTLVHETGARAVMWNRRYEPSIIQRDTRIKESLKQAGIEARSHNGGLLHEPWSIENQSGRPFQVFTPFWKHCLRKPDPDAPGPAPAALACPGSWPAGLQIEELGLLPRIPWAGGLARAWKPGEIGAQERLESFLAGAFDTYSADRNRPDLNGTSRLSPFLHFGEISPAAVWHGVRRMAERRGLAESQWRGSQFLAEVGWREFAHHLLYHFPHTPTQPLRPEFNAFPWHKDPGALRAWQRGRTGYPIVDAGMRELWATGWMHNRVRMIAASFLVKDLLIPWQEGTRWFWDTLVDADLAQNTLGWQWTAGCGADAAPYFRVFNPTTQGEKFDPTGSYIRRWCPELAGLPDTHIHAPHEAPTLVLKQAGVRLEDNYPRPIVAHATAREVALEAYSRIKKGSG